MRIEVWVFHVMLVSCTHIHVHGCACVLCDGYPYFKYKHVFVLTCFVVVVFVLFVLFSQAISVDLHVEPDGNSN